MEGVNTTVAIEKIATLTGHTENVWHLAWSPKGNLLATCGSDKTIRLWSVDTGNKWSCKAVLEGAHQRTIRKVSWSPDGRYLTSCSFDATTSIWENQDGDFECIATLEGHENEVKDAQFDKSGSLLATCSRDKTVWIWEMDADSQFECISVLPGHTQDVKSLVWHPTQELLASTSYDDTIRFWVSAGDDWECSTTLTGHQSTVWDASFDPTGEMLVSASDDKTLIIWKNMSEEMMVDSSVKTNKKKQNSKWMNVCRLSGFHKRAIYSVDWGKSGLIVTSGGDNSIKLFSQDLVTADTTGLTFSTVGGVEKAHESDINCVSWHPLDDSIFASCGDDGCISIWRVSK